MLKRLVAVIAVMLATPAEAAWLKATTRHFVVYSDTSEAALRRDTIELERFDAIMRRFIRTPDDADAEFNRVTVYVVPDIERVQKLAGGSNAAGFYVPRVTGSIAFTPRLADQGENGMSARIVLFHEYAHHFLLGNSAVAYPAWFSEGFAEFASTVQSMRGAYWLGVSADHRAAGLRDGRGLSIRQLLAPPGRMDSRQTEALYGRGWLLTHYLLFDSERRRQLARYLDLLNAGRSSIDAATEAFGDLAILEPELDRYLGKSTLPALRVEPAELGAPAVDIRPLTPGEAALIGYRMESTRGVNATTGPALYARAAKAAAPYPRDATAQGWLAKMAYDAGRLDEAEAAADAAITADPTSSQALLYKARVRLTRAVHAKTVDPAVWREARGWIVRANRARNNDAAALMLFYESFAMQGVPPSPSAVAGLYRAAALVPQDLSVRFRAARELLLDGDTPAAKRVLAALAAAPHAGPGNVAKRLLALIETGRNGRDALDALEKAGRPDGAAAADRHPVRVASPPPLCYAPREPVTGPSSGPVSAWAKPFT